MDETPDYLEFYIDLPKKLLYSKWLRPVSSSEYREGLLFLYHMVQKNRLNLWLFDGKVLTQLDVQDQKWVAEDFGIMLIGSPLTHIAIIPPDEEIIYQSFKSIRDKVYRIFGRKIIVEMVDNTETALAWLLPNLQYYRLPDGSGNSTEVNSLL